MRSTFTRLRPRPWWKTAANPPCVPWCAAGHAADEFTRGASLLCVRRIATHEAFVVEVQRVTMADAERLGEVRREPASVYAELIDGDDMTPASALALAGALAGAADTIASGAQL